MIGIFKTNISTHKDCNNVISALAGQFLVETCTVDLEDCDKVLRIIGPHLEEDIIISFVRNMGYQCAILD